ncbi:hypothetical protein HBO07_01255 [Pseudomonas proteolytica]|uniref:NEL-type E3 ubiquitin ligase domain-containing protein n=1 Tax=Pseudomonas proteolytica TaxID=219574 RepID=UPI0014757B21|nr:NEL-type E3 ubiquitin ligase domain-containing protein [Pseudomonas proteolytica]NMZ09900.1 hypothetical protein [Pseudomonas proteolytica]
MTDSPVLPPTPSIHGRLLKTRTPQWLIDATSPRREALKRSDAPVPPAYRRAPPEQRQRVRDCIVASFTAQTALDKTMSALQDIETFARPLLVNALKDQFGVTLAPRIETWLCLRKSLQVTHFNVDTLAYDFLKLELLQAALHNFEEAECEQGAFHPSSGFKWQVPTRGVSPQHSLLPLRMRGLEVHQFMTMCRTLDLGGQYRSYISEFFNPSDAAVETTLRQQFIASQKTAMRAAAELALVGEDITHDDYNMLLSVIDGERSPRSGGQPVWICDLGLMKLRMTGCVLFLAFDQARAHFPILYIPHDPYTPLKRYASLAQMLETLTQRLITPGSASTRVTRPTDYQRFFSQFVDDADRPHYFSEFTEDAADATLLEKIGSNFAGLGQTYELISKLTPFTVNNLPAMPLAPQVPNPQPHLAPIALALKGQVYGSDKVDLWSYLYEQHRQKCIADAASRAVPTADVDARVRKRKLAMLLNVGLFGLSAVAGFVPVLGEIMMAVMVEQLLSEVIEAAQEWSEGDRQAAKAHIIDLAQNLALIGLTAAGGAALSRLKPEPVIEGLVPVQLPNAKVRLWKPDLAPYKQADSLVAGNTPNALGQYTVGNRHYVRIDNGVYEKAFDPLLKKWRIQHPHDPMAYQPVLEHNGLGAWRHRHESPLAWDRLTLLRRLGHITDSFADETLRVIGEVSGVDDDVLRKVHMDGLPVPAALADTLEQFQVDQEVEALIGRLRRGDGLDSRDTYAVPLALEMRGWPRGRVVEVFEQAAVDLPTVEERQSLSDLGEAQARYLLGTPDRRNLHGVPLSDEWGGPTVTAPKPTGRSVRYGSPASADDLRPTLKITRADLLQGRLAQAVLAGLDEQETAALLGTASNTGELTRAQRFNERLAEHALHRQQALFDALLRAKGPHPADTGLLARRFPSLSHRARSEVLNHASPQELTNLHHHARVSARLDHLARTAVQQGRVSRAISGLHRDRLASPDSDRLALHGLERLPGWPQGLRLELRLDSHRGPLVDSIGDADAAVRRYLVKHGDQFQAFDAAGNALNSADAPGRNLFPSILAALPDDTRQALALTGQGTDLQTLLATYARAHRQIVAEQILKLRAPRSRPSLRLQRGRLGYALSGRGPLLGMDEYLIVLARGVYPNLADDEVLGFIEARRRDGESERKIALLFANRQRELTTLRATLEQWAGDDASRLPAVNDVIDCWRQGLDRERAPHATLNLRADQVLPEWEADFSHVQTLNLSGARLLAEEPTQLLRPFPRVQQLELYVSPEQLGAVTQRLAHVSGPTAVSITGPELTYTPQALQPLERMTGLQQLSLVGSLPALDLSGLTSLRRLSVSGTLSAWPQGLLALEHLEFVDFTGTPLRNVPPEMFAAHHRLWRGLHMNWSEYEPQDFMRVYEHLHDNPAHLVDEQRLVQTYCEGALSGLKDGDQGFADKVLAGFRAQDLSARQRLDRVNALRKEYRELFEVLEQWSDHESSVGRVEVERQVATEKILDCWRHGLQPRLVTDGELPAMGAHLDLSGATLVDLPRLPAPGFRHVRSLDLSDIGVSLEGINGWIGQFPQLDTLSLARNNLADLPSVLVQCPSLRHLDLSHNWLVVSPAIQAQVSQLTGLVSLRLSYNPIRSLDVSALRDLHTLDLSHSALDEWPQGVLELPSLQRLDLSYSAVTGIPEAALSGHDPLLLNTHLRGCRLDMATRAEARLFARRYPATRLENPLGIPRDLLAQGLTGGKPEYFPEDALRRPELLVALPTASAADAVQLAPSARLQRLAPALDDLQAAARIDELHSHGLDAQQVQARLDEWEAQYAQWVLLLNDWMDVHGYLDGSWVNALDRRRAADRLLESWRHTLCATPPAPGLDGMQLLDFSQLSLGDLPRLPDYFAHVSELNLSRIRLTAQGSNGFLRAFTHVRKLTLSHNGLRAIPDAIAEFRGLRHLDMASNELQTTEPLSELGELEWLDLSENLLTEVELGGLARLNTLYLQHNLLDDWPMAVLELRHLRSLNLQDNWIENLPEAALALQYRQLLAGTSLSGNRLEQAACERLQVYLAQTGGGLGFSTEQLDAMIRSYQERDELAAFDSPDYSLNHPDIETPQEQKARWFGGVAPYSSKHRLWQQLFAQEGSGDFFFTLSQLRNTEDFLETPADLTQRVWALLEAMDKKPSLRRDLFARATALMPEVTCGDGRILMFNELETRALEFDALTLAEKGQDGATLLKFARSMLRLEAVEEIAQATIESREDIDPAEIRLALRIGLAQRLELPRQPLSMLYSELSEVTTADLDSAFAAVLERERVSTFEERLVGLEYWLNYLKQKYAADFSALAQEVEQKAEALEERYPDNGSDYLRDYAALGTWSKEQRTALAIRLTRQERQALNL